MARWARYVGPTRHPLRSKQVVLILESIQNDPLRRKACVVVVGVNNSSTCALLPEHLVALRKSEVLELTDEDFRGGL